MKNDFGIVSLEQIGLHKINCNEIALKIINKVLDVVIENCEGYDCCFAMPIDDIGFADYKDYQNAKDCKNQIKSHLALLAKYPQITIRK